MQFWPTASLGPFLEPEPHMTSDECVAHGGHCHERTGLSRASVPPQYQERCKHCGHKRWAKPREPFEYIDEEDA
jgi:hypothetical protein